MDENTAKNCHLCKPISQKLISKSQSHSLNAALEKNFSRSEKVSSHRNFTHILYYVKTPSEQKVLPV